LENFLLKNEDNLTNIKLIDFGLSNFENENKNATGTPYYVAPEILQNLPDIKSDVWSLGVIMYCLLCGTVPFKGLTK
jgi:serine/threonine protein kinase